MFQKVLLTETRQSNQWQTSGVEFENPIVKRTHPVILMTNPVTCKTNSSQKMTYPGMEKIYNAI